MQLSATFASAVDDDLNGSDIVRSSNVWLCTTIAMAIVAEAALFLLTGRTATGVFAPSTKWIDWTYFAGAMLGVPAFMLFIGGVRPLKAPHVAALLALGALIFGYDVGLAAERTSLSPSSVVCLILGPLGAAFAVLLALRKFGSGAGPHGNWHTLYARAALLLATLTIATKAALEVNRLFFPATWDYHVYRIDAAFGSVPATLAQWNQAAWPSMQSFTLAAYGVLIFALYAVIGLAIRQGAMERLHIWRTLVFPFAVAWLLYAVVPVSGPAYAFFSGEFPGAMPAPLSVAASQVVIPPVYRNGMPSMHLTGALLVWMIAVGLRHRIAVWGACALVVSTAWCTLATGEHYLLDLVVAVAYAAFLGTCLIWPQRLRQAFGVAAPVWLCGVNFVAWIVALRSAPAWLSNHPGVVQTFSAWTLLCAALVFHRMVRAATAENAAAANPSPRAAARVAPAAVGAPRWVVGLFAASGVAGLIYEVVYAKALAVTFGSTALASYTVLATYMGGMALGAWLGGRLADKVQAPLRAYALCEMVIGVYAAATPQLFDLTQSLYVFLSLDKPPDADELTILRVGLGVMCLGLPTTLMGATMPMMFKHLRQHGVSSQRAIAPLYGANVLGAAVGAIVAGYWILPSVGRDGGTYLAAAASLMIALYAFERVKKTGSLSTILRTVVPTTTAADAVGPAPPVARQVGITALMVLFIGGAVTLGLEVNSMHLLAVVAGNSVYAFALMLATFLAGLGLGSSAGEFMLRRFQRTHVVGWAQCGIALTIALTAHAWDGIPSYFGSFELYPVRLDFAARELIRAAVCASAMFPAAFCIGVSYPAAMSLSADWLSPHGGARGFGLASGLNTLGNIAGVIGVGFWLLPTHGSLNSALVLATVSLVLAVLALVLEPTPVVAAHGVRRRAWKYLPVPVVMVAMALTPSGWDLDELATGGNVYFARQVWGHVIDSAESVTGGVTSVAKNEAGVLTLLTNGKFQGNDSRGGEMVAQESFALFPLLHTSQRDSALVIGYGTGMTTRVLDDAGFKRVEVAELSKDIVDLANRHFKVINQDVTSRSNVRVHFTDGRNFLLTQSRKFDLVSIEVTSIWFAGAANLYNKEFYALAKSRLSEGGVLQQWIQLHHMAPIDLAYVIGSVRAEFKYVWLYVRGGQGVIVASNSERSGSMDHRMAMQPQTLASGASLDADELVSHRVLSPPGVDRFIRSLDPSMSRLVSTDRNLYLEHSTPKGNVLGETLTTNVQMLSAFEHDGEVKAGPQSSLLPP